MRWGDKIKAGSLQFVLFIGAIIAVLLMMFVLIAHTQNLFNKKTVLIVDLVQAANFGIDSSLNQQIPTDNNTELLYQLDKPISIKTQKEYWGIFEEITSTAVHGKLNFTKTALVGSNGYELPALYLRDKQRPLILAGNTRITGDAYLPEQGIRMGNISGNSYAHNQLLYGEKRKSKGELPRINSTILKQIKQLATNGYLDREQEISLKKGLVFKNSFESPTVFVNERVIYLEDVLLSGNIVISASDKIIVEPSSQLRDVVLIAPEILVKDGVKGNFQAIATKNIYIGRNCNLSYPSALVVSNLFYNSNKNTESDAKIVVSSFSKIKGVLVYLTNNDKQSNAPAIKIDKNAIIHGEIYCEKNLELKGSVFGNVTTDAFIALENGSIYQNHIYNGVINRNSLTNEYGGLLNEFNPSKKVLKWLY
ncbi:hypothetical protein D9V96_020350 [Zobellia laminariae]|uniref:hypothetical protein n=1 Tax=Zobellia laminariae TaxID=248906 RepID=UPI0012D98B5F|nr:hypothetical protein [Zobellia laminariae]